MTWGSMKAHEVVDEFEIMLYDMDPAELELIHAAVQDVRATWVEHVAALREHGRHENGDVVTDGDLRFLGHTTNAYDKGLMLLTLMKRINRQRRQGC